MSIFHRTTPFFVILGLGFAACDDHCPDNPDDRRFGGILEISAAEFEEKAGFAGGLTEVTLDNYTPIAFEFNSDNTFKYHRPNGGRFRIDDLGGLIPGAPDVTFTIPASRSAPYTLYLDDMHATTVAYSVRRGRFVVNLSFESQGTEVFTNCIDNIVCGVGDPHMHLNNTTIELSLILGSGDRLVDRVEVTFDAQVENAPGLCVDNFFAFLCDIFRPEESELERQVANEVANSINGNDALFDALDDGVRALVETMVELPPDAEITTLLIGNNGGIHVLYDLPCSTN